MDKRTVVITGGVGGIGSKMAQRMAQRGHNIILSYLNDSEKDKAQQIIDDIKKETESEGVIVEADVTNYDQVKSLVDKAVETYGRVDVMVNNAGVFKEAIHFHEMDVKQMRSTLEVNLLGVMYGTHAVLPHMIKAENGVIVNTASIAGLQSSPMFADYSASKSGVIGFTRSIAGEYADKNIRANAIAPGIIDTSMVDHLKDAGNSSLDNIPLGRLGTPEDIADALDYVVRADYLTGQTISPNGGVIMP